MCPRGGSGGAATSATAPLLCLVVGLFAGGVFEVEAFLLTQGLGKADTAPAAAVENERIEHQHLTPKLDPASSRKFFLKEYPQDSQPKVGKSFPFDHPYPTVQEPDDFDRDYLKDENGDNGYWKAQTEYDNLRAKLRKEKQDVKEAIVKDKVVRAMEDEVKVKEDEVRKKENEVKEKVKRREKEEAHGNFTAEHLNDCRRELKEARMQLKKLLAELESAKQNKTAANEAVQAAKAKERAAETEEQEFRVQVKEEVQEHKAAQRAYEEQASKVKQLERDLSAAAAEVRQIRGEAVHPAARNGATGAIVPYFLVLALLANVPVALPAR